MSTSSRILAVDWMKGLMIIIIVLHHYFLIPRFNHTYLPVDFFFCIAGYFLMNHFSQKRSSALSYTVKRIKQFFPALILVFLLSCLILHSRLDFSSFDRALQTIVSFSFLLTLTNGLVATIPFPILDITWFLSILIISGYFVYAVLGINKHLACSIILPLCMVFGYTLIFSQSASIQHSESVLGFNLSLIRGLCDLSAGVLVYEINREYKDAINRKSVLVNCSGIFATFLFVAVMLSEEYLDVVSVILLPIIILSLVTEKSWLNSFLKPVRGGILSLFGNHSLEILLIHQLVMISLYKVLEAVGMDLPAAVIIVLDLVLVLFSAMLLRKVCKLLWKTRS